MWLVCACFSAFFAGITSILAKFGIRNTDSDIATAIRTVVVLCFSWLTAFIAGSAGGITRISGKSLAFLILSGLATGASWLCYFRALSVGDVNKVVAVDKSGIVLTILFAVVVLRETENLAVRLFGTALIAAGTYLMIEPKKAAKTERGGSHDDAETAGAERGTTEAAGKNYGAAARTESAGSHDDAAAAGANHGAETAGTKSAGRWLFYAALSAVFAALVSILAKTGIRDVESNLATAVRTGVVLAAAWLIVFLQGKQRLLRNLNRKELLFIVLSGFATGASWLCYFRAIKYGPVSAVAPIDKMSVLITTAFSVFVLKEKLSKKSAAGLILIVCGTLATTIFS